MGISAWIVPTTQDSQKLDKIMKPKHDTSSLSKTSYPTFDPHVTLATGIPPETPLTEIRKALGHSPTDTDTDYNDVEAPTSGKFKVEFASLEVGGTYHQSVFIRCKATQQIVQLHDNFHSKLGIEVKTSNFPHLSVAYIEEPDERQRLVNELKDQGRVRGNVEVLCGMEMGGWVDGFEAAEVWIVNCTGPVRQWEVMDRIPL